MFTYDLGTGEPIQRRLYETTQYSITSYSKHSTEVVSYSDDSSGLPSSLLSTVSTAESAEQNSTTQQQTNDTHLSDNDVQAGWHVVEVQESSYEDQVNYDIQQYVIVQRDDIQIMLSYDSKGILVRESSWRVDSNGNKTYVYSVRYKNDGTVAYYYWYNGKWHKVEMTHSEFEQEFSTLDSRVNESSTSQSSSDSSTQIESEDQSSRQETTTTSSSGWSENDYQSALSPSLATNEPSSGDDIQINFGAGSGARTINKQYQITSTSKIGPTIPASELSETEKKEKAEYVKGYTVSVTIVVYMTVEGYYQTEDGSYGIQESFVIERKENYENFQKMKKSEAEKAMKEKKKEIEEKYKSWAEGLKDGVPSGFKLSGARTSSTLYYTPGNLLLTWISQHSDINTEDYAGFSSLIDQAHLNEFLSEYGDSSGAELEERLEQEVQAYFDNLSNEESGSSGEDSGLGDSSGGYSGSGDSSGGYSGSGSSSSGSTSSGSTSSGGSSSGNSSSGSSSSGSSSSGGNTTGGDSTSGGDNSSGTSPDEESDPRTPTYTAPAVVNKVKRYIRIVGNENGVRVIWSNSGKNGTLEGSSSKRIGAIPLPGAPITMEIGGTVWNETKKTDGRKSNGENILAAVQVQLVDAQSNEVVATTTTDSKGIYRFFGQKGNGVALVNGLKKYYVVFTYNGQTYHQTYYKNDLTGTYSNAKEIDRDGYNKKFENIYSDSANYYIDGNARKAYASSQRIEDDNGNYITYDNRALTFNDVYTEFLKETLLKDAEEPAESDYNKVWDRSVSYDNVLNGTFKEWLANKGITKQYNSIKNYINDTFIQATTKQNNVVYPVYNQFVIKNIDSGSTDYKKKKTPSIKLDKTFTYLYSIHSDQARNVNYGLWTRPVSDLALQKDIYKTTLVVNGKKEVYTYDKKAGSINKFWDTGDRTGSNLYNSKNGTDGTYIREIRKSDYLYNENDAYGDSKTDKNLQAFVTYKIAVKNQGKYDTKINEIVDYYDADTFDFDGELQGNQYRIKQRNYSGNNVGGAEEKMLGQAGGNYVYSYVGQDSNGTKQKDLVVKTQGINNNEAETIKGKGYNYQTLYLTGIKGEKGQDKLAPNETAYIYVTYKVKNDTTTERIILDQDLKDKKGALKIGKKGIAEVNSYATYYKENDTIPNDYGKDPVSVKGKAAGVVDTDSNPGSLKPKDLDDNGNIITDSDLSKDRQQDDCDKSPNINMIIDTNEDSNRVRTFNGAVFEDERNKSSEKAVVGDGKEKNETRVNGVTVQLVELIRNVNEDGVFEGTYAGEKVWSNYTYSDNVHGSKTLPRYASGSDKSSVVISGTGLLAVNPDNLTKDNGEYSFKSIPAGDFYIRFIYGDTAETTMIDDNKWNSTLSELEGKTNKSYADSTEIERIKNIKSVNDLVPTVEDYQGNELKGRNAKSYNGQDYKSTTYQAGVEQTGEYGNYYGIGGFTDYNKQNFYIVDDLKLNKDGTGARPDVVYSKPNVNKTSLYYYNINAGDNNKDVSDAKDIYAYRENVNSWSKGANKNTLINNRAEVLASFEKPLTYYSKDDSAYSAEERKLNQLNALNELMDNTYMVAQTGLINTEIERTTQGLDVKDGKYGEKQKYSINDLNLGLVERPKAGLKLNKEIDNFNFTNSNSGIAFDVTNNQSVSNLSFSKHEQHEVKYADRNTLRKISTATSNKFAHQAQKAPERLQLYVDSELMHPATVRVRYKYTVENVGEVDYTGPTFYYTGIPAQGDKISTTNAEQVIDYVSNSITYDTSKQENNVAWSPQRIDTDKNKKTSKFSLIGSSQIDENKELKLTEEKSVDTKDYVNRYYLPIISTYNTIITTKKLANNGGLMPTVADSGTSKTQTTLTLTQEITSQNEEDNLTFNNLAEIIETSNTLGRRCAYSIPGNQEMADQSLGKDAAEGANTRTKWILPEEIDADSAQTIVIMPPTGEVNYLMWIIIATIAVAVLGLGGLVLKKCLLKKEK